MIEFKYNDGPSVRWLHGKWQEHVAVVPDGAARLLLTDPPYGMGYQSSRRKVRHDAIADDKRDAGEIACEVACAMLPKLAGDAHVLMFCQWKHMQRVADGLSMAGLDVRACIVWNKNNHGSGWLGGFAPKHEFIVHATKGAAEISPRLPDVLDADRVATDRHPTEKPLPLIRQLVEACTKPGDLVLDPFGGVATTAEACISADGGHRACWSTELHDKYYAAGRERLWIYGV